MVTRSLSGKRIALVTDSIYPYNTGGKETRTLELSTRLVAAGYDVHIYTMHWWKEASPDKLQGGVWLHALSPLYPLYDGERRSTKQGVLFGLACFKLIFERFDVVDVDHIPFFPLFSVRLVAWLKRKPMFATWHEVWGRTYWQEYMGRQGIVASLIEHLSTRLPSQIIAVSEMTENRLSTELSYTHPVALVYNGIDQSEIHRIRAKRTTSDIIYAGRLIEHKNVDMLLEAIALLKTTNPDITCRIFGDGPERTKLESLAFKLGLEQNVHFYGFIPNHQDVYAYMKAAKVSVLPSTREGFGISVIEANACGLPVVTFDHPANAAKDLINPTTGLLAKPNARDLAKKIDKLLTKKTSPEAIRAAVAHYDWDVSVSDLEKVYAL